MKLNKEVLIEIMSIIQDALINGEDASQKLRELDLSVKHGVPEVEGGIDPDVGTLVLSMDYKLAHARQGTDTWSEG